jgi:hypothetical protein
MGDDNNSGVPKLSLQSTGTLHASMSDLYLCLLLVTAGKVVATGPNRNERRITHHLP